MNIPKLLTLVAANAPVAADVLKKLNDAVQAEGTSPTIITDGMAVIGGTMKPSAFIAAHEDLAVSLVGTVIAHPVLLSQIVADLEGS